jgi:hypothetical protein
VFGIPVQANPHAPLLDNTPLERTLAVSDNDPVAGLSAIEAAIDLSQSEIQITEVYIGLQGRAPDSGGLAYWANQLDSAIAAGQSRSYAMKKLTNDITLSEEWYAGIGANDGLTQSGAEAIVRAMYLNLFARPATASDVAYWSADLTTGRVTESEMVVLLIVGAQSKGNADSQVLGLKRQAASYYSSNITAASFTRESATEAVADVTDEQSLLASVEYNLYSRDVTELMELVDFPECENPSNNHIKFMLDVDLDGDQDAVMGFDCITFTQDADDLVEQLTYDEFFGWITDSYLAVFINDNGEFRNDQSIFDGEYPVYDKTLKSWWPINVGDVNGDGYEDISIYHHWDNSRYNSINERRITGRDKVPASEFWSAGSVMISDGEGGYKAHLLPMQFGEGVPQFYTDELGDTYVWIFSEQNTMWSGEYGAYDDYQKRELDLEVRPYVGKVEGADLIDVTDRYWEKLYANNSRDKAKWCHIARSMAVNGEYQGHAHHTWQMPCSNPENWLPTNYAAEQLDGKVYVNPARGINHNQIYTGDDRITHCNDQSSTGTLVEQSWAIKQCTLDASTNQPWMFDSLKVLAMDSERGVYVQNTHQYEAEFRYYLNDPDVPVSQGGDYEALFFIHMDDHIQMNTWGWGVTIAEEPGTGDVLAMSNMGGTMLDPGATIDDVEQLALFILREYEPQTGDWSNTIGRNITDPRSLIGIMKAGFCPDVLLTVEPEDCLDPDDWGLNSAYRYLDLHGDDGRSIGHRINSDSGDIVTEPKLTNLNMAYNPFRTQLIDFDSDGDLDLYINDNNQDCGPMCLMENLDDYEFEQSLEGIWAQADTEFWEMRYQEVERSAQGLFHVASGEINISDINGDGILDFYALKSLERWVVDNWDYTVELNIIYGE